MLSTHAVISFEKSGASPNIKKKANFNPRFLRVDCKIQCAYLLVDISLLFDVSSDLKGIKQRKSVYKQRKSCLWQIFALKVIFE